MKTIQLLSLAAVCALTPLTAFSQRVSPGPASAGGGIRLVIPEQEKDPETQKQPEQTAEPLFAPLPTSPAAPSSVAPAPVASTPASAPVLTGRVERKVDFVWFSGGPNNPSGGASPMTIRIENNPSGEPSVGVIEEFVSGLGDMWRSATWMAAINATQAQRQFVNEYEFLVRVGGLVDGPSAGMLMAGAMLSALRGDELLPGTTMSGTINPDGTCGPVGGLPQKMRGAREKGYTRFGYPLGLRMSYDMATRQSVDLMALGRELGFADVREIATLEEAYEFLTGARHDLPAAARDGDMALAFDMQQQFRSRSEGLTARIQTRIPRVRLKLQRAPSQLVAIISPLLEMLNKHERDKELFEKSGWFAASYAQTVTMDIIVRFIELQADFLEPIVKGDLAAAEAQVASLAHITGVVEAFAKEAALASRRKTIGGRLNALDAMGNYAQSLTRTDIAAAHLANYKGITKHLNNARLSRRDRDTAAERLVVELNSALLNYAIAEVMVEYSRELLALGSEEGPVAAENLAALEPVGKAFASAGAASLAYYDSTVLKPRADATGASMDEIKAVAAQEEFMYPFVQFASRGSIIAARIFPEPHERALYQIALGNQAYLQAASLVNKSYSLGVGKDEKGALRLENRQLLTAQLDEARRRALHAAARCQQVLGFIPSTCKVQYQLGVAYREGDDEQKLLALDSFWGATRSADIALLLAK